ncbi:putative F-box domain, leucine-rich repeat domain superfamily, F-box-like domain superfamily [Helianthus anomalus]
MPDNVITHILDRLSVQDAVKTTILSRNWRFKWTTLSQHVFDDNFLKYLSKDK